MTATGFERRPGGGLWGDEGGLETRAPPSDEDGDGERSGAADEPCRRDDVPAAEGPAPGLTIFLRGMIEIVALDT